MTPHVTPAGAVTQDRPRTPQHNYRFTPAQAQAIHDKARAWGLSKTELMRRAVLAYPMPTTLEEDSRTVQAILRTLNTTTKGK